VPPTMKGWKIRGWQGRSRQAAEEERELTNRVTGAASILLPQSDGDTTKTVSRQQRAGILR
jgi:hypothetical protein